MLCKSLDLLKVLCLLSDLKIFCGSGAFRLFASHICLLGEVLENFCLVNYLIVREIINIGKNFKLYYMKRGAHVLLIMITLLPDFC